MSNFIYTLNCSTIRPAPLMEKIRIAAAVDYRAIELWHDDLDAYVQQGGKLADVRKLLNDSGLEVPTTIYLKGWFETTGEEHRRELEECKRRMEQSVAVGAVHIIAGPPMGKADLELGGRNYRELLAIGRQIGVKPAMEFLGFVEELNTIDGALEVVQRADDPDGTIVLDPFHIFRGGGSMESIRKLTAAQIAICHFNDIPALPPRVEQHDKDRVYPGDGVYDLKGMLALLRGVGYDRWLSLELFREDLWTLDPQDVAKVGLEKMRAVVEG